MDDLTRAPGEATSGLTTLGSSSGTDWGRFAPGTLLAGRFRIVAPLGRGGMGEVYRADDLKLGQTVALKFLPDNLMHDAARLAQFHNEVRVARTIAHRNVCRTAPTPAQICRATSMAFSCGKRPMRRSRAPAWRWSPSRSPCRRFWLARRSDLRS
jgi:hypothetical protein